MTDFRHPVDATAIREAVMAGKGNVDALIDVLVQMLSERDRALEDYISHHVAPAVFSFSGTPAPGAVSPAYPPSREETYSRVRVVSTTPPGVGGLQTQVFVNGTLFDTITLAAGVTDQTFDLVTPMSVTPDDVVILFVVVANGAVNITWRFLT